MIHPPLFDLEAAAPAVDSLRYRREKVIFPFSNDECTSEYFQQLTACTETAEYQQTQHRVALLVGESALAANLVHIPEETIVLLDISPDMNIFMQEYVRGLREASGPAEWASLLAAVGPEDTIDLMLRQSDRWEERGVPHPLGDKRAFVQAQRLAREKVIVPWLADIGNRRDMKTLGSTLRDQSAQVTMMNLTNVLTFVQSFRKPTDCAKQLGTLPVANQAPILTSSIKLPPRSVADLFSSGNGHEVTGPFFGLENLARASMPHARHSLGAITERNVTVPPVDEGELAAAQQAYEALRAGSVMAVVVEDGLLVIGSPPAKPESFRWLSRLWRRLGL
jgi:hypothetical protein